MDLFALQDKEYKKFISALLPTVDPETSAYARRLCALTQRK